jgi:hypothetical protein
MVVRAFDKRSNDSKQQRPPIPREQPEYTTLMTKTCTTCGSDKSHEDFYFIKSVGYRQARCKECTKSASRAYTRAHPGENSRRAKEWKKKNPERWASIQRNGSRKYRYKLDRDGFERLVKLQHGKCAACGRAFKNDFDAIVDHCHKTLIVRGLLCRKCNFAEGYLGTPEAALGLYQYMLKNALFYQGTS